MRNFLLFSILFLTAFHVHAQCSIECEDVVVCRENKEVQVIPEFTASPVSLSYNLSEADFSPETIDLNAINIPLLDDDVAGPFSIGFEFEFFGFEYSEFYVGSNGWLSFSQGQPSSYVPVEIPSSNPGVPKNCIMGPWEDWNPSAGGTVSYKLVGEEPYRKLVLEFNNLAHFVCGESINSSGYFQIVLEETSNEITNHLIRKPLCSAENSTLGIINYDGSRSYSYTGRNASEWESLNESINYTPTNVTSLGWSVDANTDPSLNTLIFVPEETGEHTVTATDLVGNSCSSTFTVHISTVLDPFLERIENILHCDLSGYQYQWFRNGESIDGAIFQDLTLTEYGSYTVELTDELGCSYLSRVHLYTKPNSIQSFSEGLIVYQSHDFIRLEFSSALIDPILLRLYDINGKIVSEKRSKNTFQIANNYPSGLYFITLETTDGNIYSEKIIIE